MAEPFGIATAAMGLAGTFTACVDCFEYIQFGRKFGGDFEKCLLKLEIIKLRLTRWGASIDIDSKTYLPETEDDIETERLLGNILLLFSSTEETTKRFRPNAKVEDLPLLESAELSASSGSLLAKTREIAARRQKGTGFFKKTRWALYEKKKFERLIDDLNEFVGALVELFPAAVAKQEMMSKEDVEEFATVDDGKALASLKEFIGEEDIVLRCAVEEKIKDLRGGHVWGNAVVGGNAWLNQGDAVAEGLQGLGNNHVFGNAHIAGNARVNQGDRVGMKGDFWA